MPERHRPVGETNSTESSDKFEDVFGERFGFDAFADSRKAPLETASAVSSPTPQPASKSSRSALRSSSS